MRDPVAIADDVLSGLKFLELVWQRKYRVLLMSSERPPLLQLLHK